MSGEIPGVACICGGPSTFAHMVGCNASNDLALEQSMSDGSLLRYVRDELSRRIDNLKDMNSPMDSHANGVLVGLIEAYELITNGVESDE